jgi:hypothetical protein
MTLQAIRVKLTATSAAIIVVYKWLRFVYEKGKHEDQEKEAIVARQGRQSKA